MPHVIWGRLSWSTVNLLIWLRDWRLMQCKLGILFWIHYHSLVDIFIDQVTFVFIFFVLVSVTLMLSILQVCFRKIWYSISRLDRSLINQHLFLIWRGLNMIDGKGVRWKKTGQMISLLFSRQEMLAMMNVNQQNTLVSLIRNVTFVRLTGNVQPANMNVLCTWRESEFWVL